jgi:hypothetical protein
MRQLRRWRISGSTHTKDAVDFRVPQWSVRTGGPGAFLILMYCSRRTKWTS